MHVCACATIPNPKIAAVELGDIGDGYFGIRITGRGDCEGLQADLTIDDGGHSYPKEATVSLEVAGLAGYVSVSTSNLEHRGPIVEVES